ncbi:MAG: MerR family transcriptional regulator [Bryobacterales bacterium]
MYTISQLARTCGLTRGALLYFESIGLMRSPPRTPSEYRVYTEADRERLQQICLYRSAGVKLRDIKAILDRRQEGAEAVLKKRLAEIQREIDELRAHQNVILTLLKNRGSLKRTKTMTKDKWVEIMRGAGFTNADMHRWHREFERSSPGDHQEFLEYLHISGEEAERIRAWSRQAASDASNGS